MKKKITYSIFLLMLIGSYLYCYSKPGRKTIDNSHRFELVFSDDFNQPNGSSPDPDKWTIPDRNPSMWARWLSKSKKVTYIENGKLVCLAIPNRDQKADTAKMLTGGVWTRDKYTFGYGKMEVRMRTNLQQGNFPAAWLKYYPKKGEPNLYAEIDLVEMFGNTEYAYQSIHTQYTMDVEKHGENNRGKFHIDVTQWHTYTVEWTPKETIWYIDGKEVFCYKKPSSRKKLKQGGWTMDRPFNAILNQSVGDGRSPMFIPHTDQTYRTEFDWIKIYRLRN